MNKTLPHGALCTTKVLSLSLLNYIVVDPTYNKKTSIFKVNTWPGKPAVFILGFKTFFFFFMITYLKSYIQRKIL